jgi:hypothetical protein
MVGMNVTARSATRSVFVVFRTWTERAVTASGMNVTARSATRVHLSRVGSQESLVEASEPRVAVTVWVLPSRR